MMLAAASLMADQLTPKEALQRLSETQGTVSRRAGRTRTEGSLKLVYTSSTDDLNTYYAFNNTKGGYVLLSADDCLPAVLGTSEDGNFDYESLPENMKWFLSLYDQAVENYNLNGTKLTTIQKDSIPAMLEHSKLGKIEWNQDEPYDNLTPRYNDKRTAPGCVAIAMAQVMAYHQWPQHGYGQATDTCYIRLEDHKTDKKLTTLTIDFSKTTYDWKNMLPKYVTRNDSLHRVQNYNDTQATAVATLAYHCGVGAMMKYGTEGSSSGSWKAAYALVNNFGYSKATRVIQHQNYTNEEWDNIIYNELQNGRPVIFGGDGRERNATGHEFVCDGFKDGLFHINWGWGGNKNQYFYLTGTGLDANHYVTPYTEADYLGYGLDAIIGLQPDMKADQGGSTQYSGTKMSCASYRIFLYSDTLELGGYFINDYYDTIQVTPGVALIGAKDTLYYNSYDGASKLGPNNYYKTKKGDIEFNVKLPVNSIAEGTYTIVPTYTEKAGAKATTFMQMFSDFDKTKFVMGPKYYDINKGMSYKIDSLASVKIPSGKTQYQVTPNDNSDNVEADSITITLTSPLYNTSKSTDIYVGMAFRNCKTEQDADFAADQRWVIHPNGHLDTFTVKIPSGLNADSAYYVRPIVWPYFYTDMTDASYEDVAWKTSENPIYDYTRLAVINMISRKPTAIDEVSVEEASDNKPVKFMRNGVVVIRREDGLYNMLGQKVE